MIYTPSRPLLISGVKHSGKSTVGAALAERLSLPFFDLDDLVTELCRSDRGGPDALRWEPREIYRRLGKSGFLELEQRALNQIARRTDPFVLALGGGTQESDEAREILSAMGILVYLHAEADLLFERIAARGLPPFLDDSRPRESFQELYERRDALYRAGADLTVSVGGLEANQAAERIITRLQEL